MSRTRLYQAASLLPHTTIRLDEKASHHLARVLRANVGDELVLFNGQGGEVEAVISHIDKKGVDVIITTVLARTVESPLTIYLAQAIARGEKMDFIVQKAVELGVNKIIPLITERCNVRLQGEREEKRVQHWQSVAISACEQSGRNIVPQVVAPLSLKEWLPTVKADRCFVLSPHVNNPFPDEDLPSLATVILLIGPEGGLTDSEVASAQAAGFLPLNLGPRVLRTETAGIAGIALLQYRYGDFCP